MRRDDSEDDAVEALVQQVRALSGGFARGRRGAERLGRRLGRGGARARASTDEHDRGSSYTETLDWDALLAALRLRAAPADCATRCGASSRSTTRRRRGRRSRSGSSTSSATPRSARSSSDDELGALVTRFEALTHDTIAQLGGRLVKTIGDEVMFVSEAPERRGARSRCGSPSGPATTRAPRRARRARRTASVVAREGDYYGPVVNLAHRLVEIAYPGTRARVRRAPRGDRPTTRRSAGVGSRDRKIRDIGRVETWPLRAGR